MAVWKFAGLSRVNRQYPHLLALPSPSPCLLHSREEAGGRGESKDCLDPQDLFNGDLRDPIGPSPVQYICSMVSLLPLIIFGFTTGNVDFLLQGWFLKIRHLLSNFFATSAPRAQGGRGKILEEKKPKQPTRTQTQLLGGPHWIKKSLKKVKTNSVFTFPPPNSI